MTKAQFTDLLRKKLAGLPQSDIDMSVEYYSEMIDERVDDGMDENAAVEQLGSIEDIVKGIFGSTPLTKIVREKVKPKRNIRVWEIILLILGFPLWFPLLIAFASVILSIYVSIWAVIISLYAAGISFAVGALAGVLSLAVYAVYGRLLAGLFMFGCGIVLAGLTILMWFVCVYATKFAVFIGRNFLLAAKYSIVGKERK